MSNIAIAMNPATTFSASTATSVPFYSTDTITIETPSIGHTYYLATPIERSNLQRLDYYNPTCRYIEVEFVAQDLESFSSNSSSFSELLELAQDKWYMASLNTTLTTIDYTNKPFLIYLAGVGTINNGTIDIEMYIVTDTSIDYAISDSDLDQLTNGTVTSYLQIYTTYSGEGNGINMNRSGGVTTYNFNASLINEILTYKINESDGTPIGLSCAIWDNLRSTTESDLIDGNYAGKIYFTENTADNNYQIGSYTASASPEELHCISFSYLYADEDQSEGEFIAYDSATTSSANHIWHSSYTYEGAYSVTSTNETDANGYPIVTSVTIKDLSRPVLVTDSSGTTSRFKPRLLAPTTSVTNVNYYTKAITITNPNPYPITVTLNFGLLYYYSSLSNLVATVGDGVLALVDANAYAYIGTLTINGTDIKEESTYTYPSTISANGSATLTIILGANNTGGTQTSYVTFYQVKAVATDTTNIYDGGDVSTSSVDVGYIYRVN